MKLGLFTAIYNNLTFEQMLEKVFELGIDMLEIGTGGYPGNSHLEIAKLLSSSDERQRYLAKLEEKGLRISAFSAHYNPLSPNPKIAQEADKLLRDTIKLAEMMSVPVVNAFSGVGSGNATDTQINWPVSPWPHDYEAIYNYQWEQKLIPYWREINQLAESVGVKIGIELHGGFLVHTPATMLRLRSETGSMIGCNFDPSHLWWQGIEPVAAVRILGEASAIHHFHAKDTQLNQDNINMYGLTDMQAYHNIQTRAWFFRTVGFGHDLKVWADILSALRIYGYDYVISIEHEDPLMAMDEGLNYAVRNLNQIIM